MNPYWSMENPWDAFTADRYSNATPATPDRIITLQSGEQVREGDMLPGEKGYGSAKLSPDGLSTEGGDIFNAFRGYVSGDGGTFGAGPSKDRQAALSALEGIAGVGADKFGFTGQESAADIDGYRKLMGGIANGDRGSIQSALNHGNSFIKRTAQAYDLGLGSRGLGDLDYAAEKARQTAGAGAGLGTNSVPVGSADYQRIAAEQAAYRPVQGAATGAGAGAGVGFGAGWQLQQARYRPVGSPGLNRVQARPLGGGAY